MFKKLTDSQRAQIEAEVRMMLHASRDCLRNQGVDTTDIPFDCRDGYYGEAFGIMRALHALGYGDYSGPSNLSKYEHPYWNLKWWFSQIEQQVLTEENYGDYGLTNNECDHCLKAYGKDAVRMRVSQRGSDDVILPLQAPRT